MDRRLTNMFSGFTGGRTQWRRRRPCGVAVTLSARHSAGLRWGCAPGVTLARRIRLTSSLMEKWACKKCTWPCHIQFLNLHVYLIEMVCTHTHICVCEYAEYSRNNPPPPLATHASLPSPPIPMTFPSQGSAADASPPPPSAPPTLLCPP